MDRSPSYLLPLQDIFLSLSTEVSKKVRFKLDLIFFYFLSFNIVIPLWPPPPGRTPGVVSDFAIFLVIEVTFPDT